MAKPPAKPKKLNIFEQRQRDIDMASGIEGVTYNKKAKKSWMDRRGFCKICGWDKRVFDDSDKI